MKKYFVLLLCLAVAVTVVYANRPEPAPAPPPPSGEVPSPPEPLPPPAAEETEPPPAPFEGANELGRVPILMYHRIVSQEGDWARSRENFRQDLAELYQRGYTLVNLSDFYDGTARIPPGRSPVVLTFDDSTQGQFNYLVADDGTLTIDPDSAVGMILAASELYPELGVGGVFFLNAYPFGQRQYWQQKLRHLVELGFELGNHTYSHPYFNRISDEAVHEDIVRMQMQITEAVPGYRVRALALPYGIAPRERQLAVSGNWSGISFRHDFIMEVGAEPAFSPHHIRHNPHSMPRIAATDELLVRWLGWLEDPLHRYIEDGDPSVLTFPAELADQQKKTP